MKLERFKERNNKMIGVVLFTIICILLIGSVILYKTFASFNVNHNFNIINGKIEDIGNIYFAFYVDNQIQTEMPNKESGYILDEENSYCGVNGELDPSIKVSLTDEFGIYLTGITTNRTKCNLKFVKGTFILGKSVKAVTSGDGLYEVFHEEVDGTLNDTDFSKVEYRFAGKNPHNYVEFNEEKWRMIGLVNVMMDDNKIEQRVKLVKDQSIGEYPWNLKGDANWETSSLSEVLKNIENGFSENVIKMLDHNIVWNIGGGDTNDLTTSMFYNIERSDSTFVSNPYTSNGTIGLIYPSDYGYATSGGTNLDRMSCFGYNLFQWSDFDCQANDWLYHQTNDWTLTPSSTAWTAYMISSFGHVYGDVTSSSKQIYPSVYLSNNVKIISGNGTYDLPYVLSVD